MENLLMNPARENYESEITRY